MVESYHTLGEARPAKVGQLTTRARVATLRLANLRAFSNTPHR